MAWILRILCAMLCVPLLVSCAEAQNGASDASASETHEAGVVKANGIEIAYQIDGSPEGEPLVFILGLGGQMSKGRDALTQEFVDRGFRVIRFDNRDAGQSTHMTEAGPPPDMETIVEALKAGKKPPLAYTLMDMANDTVSLMDALGIAKAHIMGGSMGGMIAQMVVSEYPERSLSLISLSSTSGNPDLKLGPALAKMMESTSPAKNERERLDRKVALFQALEGTRYRADPIKLRETLKAEIDRSDDQTANDRQGAAIIPYADRRERLDKIAVPALVIHGSDDPLFPLPHAHDQMEHLPNAHLKIVEGMGHIFSDDAAPIIANTVEEFVEQTR